MKKAALPSFLVVLMLLAVVVIAEAQQPKKVPRIGVVVSGGTVFSSFNEAFRQGLRDLGYVEGQNTCGAESRHPFCYESGGHPRRQENDQNDPYRHG
jgi:hypothetical protein